MKQMKQRALTLALVLAICLALLPAPAFAAKADLPEWRFLFAIFKSVDADYEKQGVTYHTRNTMTQRMVDTLREDARSFEDYLNTTGVMTAHIDIVEIDETIRELIPYKEGGSYASPAQAAPILKKVVDLDDYDHVTCVFAFNEHMGYWGLGGTTYENGTGHSCINITNEEYYLTTLIGASKKFPASVYTHEFLHFMETMSRKWGMHFGLHATGDLYEPRNKDYYKTCYTDIILNRVDGNDETGTGVPPFAWLCPPRALRGAELEIPEGAASIATYAFRNYAGLTGVSIPSTVDTIGYGAFFDCAGLTDLTIAPGVGSIGDWAFKGCTGLTSVTVPAGVASIGGSAFADCTGLTDVTVGKGLTSLGGWAFKGCTGLTSVTLPAGVASIGGSAFAGCESLTDLTIGPGITAIGDWAFSGCSALPSVTIPAGADSIGKYAFSGCESLTDVTLGPGLTTIGNSAFRGCSALSSAAIPSTVSSIEEYAFAGCAGLAEVTIPAGVTSIETWTFGNCTGLTSVSIPASVTSIGYAAFYKIGADVGTVDVYYGGTEEQWNAIRFDQFNEALTRANIHFGSQSTGASVVSSGAGSSLVAIETLNSGDFADCETVFAACYESGRMTDVASGTLDLRSMTVSFSGEVESGWVLFFLDGHRAPICEQITVN